MKSVLLSPGQRQLRDTLILLRATPAGTSITRVSSDADRTVAGISPMVTSFSAASDENPLPMMLISEPGCPPCGTKVMTFTFNLSQPLSTIARSRKWQTALPKLINLISMTFLPWFLEPLLGLNSTALTSCFSGDPFQITWSPSRRQAKSKSYKGLSKILV